MLLKEALTRFEVGVAAAYGVSEKTGYNYFWTKESLILDRLEEGKPTLSTGRCVQETRLGS
jgi:hypothetical protein